MDEGLKQRIIGAVVLVIAAVVFLPMLLSGQDETVEVVVDVPEAPVLNQQPIAPAEPVVLPATPQVPNIPTPQSAAEQRAQEQVEAEAAKAPEPEANPEVVEVTPEPAPVEEAPKATGDWVIQLGSFSSNSNAEGLSETLRSQGYNSYTYSVTIQGKPITRVYVGPLASRDAANRVRDELASKRGSKGLVVAYDKDSGRG
tara:strand:- start:4182 stop:4781 length:600 start_codon:yes stop_codon:yes gene_type:complete